MKAGLQAWLRKLLRDAGLAQNTDLQLFLDSSDTGKLVHVVEFGLTPDADGVPMEVGESRTIIFRHGVFGYV